MVLIVIGILFLVARRYNYRMENTQLAVCETSVISGLSYSDKILASSDNNVPSGTLFDEKPIDCAGGKDGKVGILHTSSLYLLSIRQC